MSGRRIPRVDLPEGVHLDTLAVREGLPPSAWGENSEALFLTSSFRQPDAASAAARFANEEEAFIYSRFTNPTVMMFERRLAALEGAEACIATSSGMSAILLLGMGLLKAGDHVVCSRSVFGSTIMLFGREFAKFGVETSFVSQTDVIHVAGVYRYDREKKTMVPVPGAGGLSETPSKMEGLYAMAWATNIMNDTLG